MFRPDRHEVASCACRTGQTSLFCLHSATSPSSIMSKKSLLSIKTVIRQQSDSHVFVFQRKHVAQMKPRAFFYVKSLNYALMSSTHHLGWKVGQVSEECEDRKSLHFPPKWQVVFPALRRRLRRLDHVAKRFQLGRDRW